MTLPITDLHNLNHLNDTMSNTCVLVCETYYQPMLYYCLRAKKPLDLYHFIHELMPESHEQTIAAKQWAISRAHLRALKFRAGQGVVWACLHPSTVIVVDSDGSTWTHATLAELDPSMAPHRLSDLELVGLENDSKGTNVSPLLHFDTRRDIVFGTDACMFIQVLYSTV